MDEWVPKWRAGIVDLRPSTLARDDGYVERYILPTFGKRRLTEIDHAMVTAWIAEIVTSGPIPWWDVSDEPKRKRRTLSPATVTKCGQILGKIMTAAVAAGRLKSSPCNGVKLPRIEHEEMRFLTPAEITTLAEAIDPSYRAAVLLGAYGGLRVGELFGLRAKRVDVLRARVDVAEILVEVSGQLHFGPPKTKAGRRAVPLPQSQPTLSALTCALAMPNPGISFSGPPKAIPRDCRTGDTEFGSLLARRLASSNCVRMIFATLP